ncbi:MAG: hypothetical protein LBH70_00850 [Spirochaetaceae bacterium]|nr:hypothetical protein [Spirochaetaceae bacterium]
MLFLLFLTVCGAFSLSLEEAVGHETAKKLRGGETLTEVQTRKARPLLSPVHYGTRMLIDSAIEDLDPSYIVENLYLYTKPAGAAADDWTAAERNALYNGMTAMSTLAGLRYYSVSEKGEDILYESSVVIDGPEAGNPQPDPAFGRTPPSAFTLYARQKDKKFGENIYRYDYQDRSNAIIMIQQNLTDMNSGPIRLIAKNKLRTILAVIDTEEHLLFYAISLIKAPSFPGMKRRIGDSFTNRTAAVIEWLSGQADKAFNMTSAYPKR